MQLRTIRKILKDTDFVHFSATAEETQVARYLQEMAEKLSAQTHLEAFPVPVSEMHGASLTVDGWEIPCEGYRLCGSGEIEAPLCYLPNTDPASLAKAKGKIVLIDGYLRHFQYQDLLDHGAVGLITYNGGVDFPDTDIDKRELRDVVANGRKVLCVNIHAKDARKLVKSGAVNARITVSQTESQADSHNVIAELPGTSDEWIVLSAHYDTVPLSHGAYDNMTGCIGLLEVLDALRASAPYRYGLRFIFCGSEERGLLGAKAYVEAHKAELDKIVLDINLDMIGSIMGKFICCVSAEEALVHFIRYFSAMRGWGIEARADVYSSDSTPFADAGVPALSFARIAPSGQSNIHSRYDTAALLSDVQIREDSAFVAAFTAQLADAVCFPVSREIPENVKEKLDEYLLRKRPK